MRVEMVEIWVRLRRLVIIAIGKSYRLVCHHPFLVGLLLFLLFMYRSFPFLFSLLVSTSPVVICTAFLLGFLLSLGDPNIPEIENEERTNHEIVSLRTEVQRDTTVVERDENFVVERYTSTKIIDEVENLIEEPISENDAVGPVDSGLVHTGPLIEDYFAEIKSDRRDIEGVDLHDSCMNERKNDETAFLENRYSHIEEMDEESVGLLYTKSSVGSIGSVIAERGDSLPSTPWKQFGEGNDDVADEDSDSGSDRAESSSPDASMADIIPMLEELHPLLNEEAPLVTRGSDHGSDASSHRSRGYREIPNDSSEESEHHDDMDDEEGRDETGGAKDEESKPEITWTEDDQKNLMDLGTLELERNQRLESLIARRRARKMMAENNLIDLNFDLPFSVSPILTTRRNPFDIPHDSKEFPGLPPIPGSAPSIMSQRRNPYDLPYDSSEEKPDLTRDSFQQEFSPLPSREMMFRRHESFNVGPSIFAPPEHDRDGFSFRPYFVPEGSSHSSFKRQISEISDISKVSSVPETESVYSAGDQDDMKIVDEDISRDVELGSDLVDPSDLVEHGSESSEDEDVIELGRPEKRVMEQDEVEMRSISIARTLSTIDEVQYNSRSSSSLLSEEHERAFNEKQHGVCSSLELEIDKVNEVADENKEPVYDLSPSSVRENLSRSSISSDLLVHHPSEMDKTFVSFSDRQIDFCTQKIKTDTSDYGTSGVMVKSEQILDHGLSEYDEKLDGLEDQDESNKKEVDLVSLSSLSSDNQHVGTSVQNDFLEEHSINEDVVLRNEDHIRSSSSNAYSQFVFMEKPMDELHFLDKPMAELSAADHKELLESPAVHLESIAEDHNDGNGLSDDHNLDQVTAETLGFQSEATSSRVHEPDFIEGDEIKEIDEWIMELENVGGFRIGELRSSTNEMPLVEAQSVADIDSIFLATEPVLMTNEAELNPGFLALEAEEVKFDDPSIEETKADSSQIGVETENVTVSEPIHNVKIDYRMHEVEATPIQDTDTAFREINDEEIEKSMIVDSLDAEPWPEEMEAEVAEISEDTENKTVSKPFPYNMIDSALHEFEATCIEDLNTDFWQINDVQTENPVIVDSLDAESLSEKVEDEVAEIGEAADSKTVFEPILYGGIDSGMHELEATSIQDIDAVFRQINDEEIEKPVTVDSMDAESLPEIVEAKVAQISEETQNKAVSEPKFYNETGPAMFELETTSVEDINTAFRQIKEEILKPVIVESLDAESLPGKIEAEVPETREETESKIVFEQILHDEIDSAMHDLEATSIQDIDSALRQINDEEITTLVIVDSQHAESLPEQNEADVSEISKETEDKTVSEPILCDEIDSAVHELEATPIEVISTVSRQINDEETEMPEIADSLVTESLLEHSEAEVPDTREETENKTVSDTILYDEIDSAMREIEATSVEDTNKVFWKIEDVQIEKSVNLDSLHAESSTERNEAEVAKISEEAENQTVSEQNIQDETDFGMYELEATWVEDINSAFRQINEEEIEKPVNPLDADSLLEKTEDEVAEVNKETENKIICEPIPCDEIDSVLEDLEATSIQDIDTVFRQIKGEEIEKPVSVDSLDGESLSGKIEAKVSEINAPEPPTVERSIKDIDLAIEKHNYLERFVTAASEYFNPYIVEAEDEAEEINSGKLELDSTFAKDIDETFSNSAFLESVQSEEIDSGMKQIESQSLEDLYSAFRKIKEETGNPVGSLEADSLPGKCETGVSEIEIPELPVVEARSIEGIGLASVNVCDIEKNNSQNLENDEPDSVEADDRAEEISSTIVELDAKSVEDIDEAIMQINKIENPAVFESIPAKMLDLEIKDFEVRSPEDVNLTFRHIKAEVEKPVNIASLVADLATDKSEAGVSEIETPELPAVETEIIEDIGLKQVHDSENSSRSILENDKPVLVEAEYQTEETLRSIEEIDIAFNQINYPQNTTAFETVHAEESASRMKELEAQSREDIESAFRQFKEEETGKPIAESLNTDFILEKDDAEISETDLTLYVPSLEETTEMESRAVDARSIEHVFNDKPYTGTEDASEPCSSMQVESENKPNSFDDDTLDIGSKTQENSHPARSVEDTDDLEKQLKSKIEDGSARTKSNDVLQLEEAETSTKEPIKAQTSRDFSKEVESSVDLSSSPETRTNMEVPNPHLESDDLNLILSDGRDEKKGKAPKSKSGSGSSSSSSSSSSDSD